MRPALAPFQLFITWLVTFLTIGNFTDGYRIILGGLCFSIDLVYHNSVLTAQQNFILSEKKKAKDLEERKRYEVLHKKYGKK